MKTGAAYRRTRRQRYRLLGEKCVAINEKGEVCNTVIFPPRDNCLECGAGETTKEGQERMRAALFPQMTTKPPKISAERRSEVDASWGEYNRSLRKAHRAGSEAELEFHLNRLFGDKG